MQNSHIFVDYIIAFVMLTTINFDLLGGLMKRIAGLLVMLMCLFIACMTTQTRQEIENELLNVIKQVEPMAKEKETIKASLYQTSARAKYGPSSSKQKDVTEMVQMQLSAANGTIYQRNINLDTQMRPYLYQINHTKYKFISRFGEIEYNNFIVSKGYEWGLGIYW